MHHKSYEHIGLDNIAREFGTPVYFYNIDAIVNRYQEICDVFNDLYRPVRVVLSYKTCPILSILHILHQEGADAEVVSEFEHDIAELLQQSLSVPLRKVLNGPNQTDKILKHAILHEDQINVDNAYALGRVHSIAKTLNREAEVGVRLSLGGNWDRFGFPVNDQLLEYLDHFQSQNPMIKIKGIHVHIGTAIRELGVFRDASKALAEFLKEWPFPWPIKWLNLGGGLAGISPKWEDKNQAPNLPDLEKYALSWLEPLSELLGKHKPELILEPGRTLFEPFGNLLCRVVSCRFRDTHNQSLIIDGGINAVPTARVYRHPIYTQRSGSIVSDIYGPLCLQADTLVKGGLLPLLDSGDFVMIQGIGGYNQSRSVPFIQPRPGAVGLYKQRCYRLRNPETLESHLSLEVWPV